MNAVAPIIEAPAGVGHNGAPLTPYEAVKIHLEDLLLEARNWADGEKVENQAQADEISRLIEDLRLGEKAADEARIAEKAPFDEQIAEIQERFNVYIAPLKNKKPGKVPVAVEVLKAALKPFLEAEKARKDAEAAEARKIAEAAQEAAAAAMRAAAADNLAEREAAEALVEDARNAERAANRAAGDKAHANGGSRAMGLRTYYRAEITEPKAALIHYAANQREALLSLLLSLAQADVNQGKRQIPGVTVHEETRL